MTTATIEAAHGTQTLSDDRLMADLNAGEVEASLRALKERYEVRVHNLVHGIVRDSHLADDVTQEVFTKVFFKSHLYRPGSSFRAWLLEIARNQALSAIRARRSTPKLFESIPDCIVLAQQLVADIAKLQLCKTCLHLQGVRGLSFTRA